jgi:predicted nucleic acid-binding protein
MILQNAKMLAGLGLKAKDALHLACAIDAECQYFVTADDRILRRGKDVQDIILIDPTALVRELNL